MTKHATSVDGMKTVVTIATCLAFLVGCTGTSGNGANPRNLIGSWHLIDLQGFKGTAHAVPDWPLTFRFSDGGLGVGPAGCASVRTKVGFGILQVGQDWVSRQIGGCPHLGAQQGRFLFDQVLGGTTTWEIHDGKLTLSKDGATVVFQRDTHA